jgi:HSP20 family protein
MTSITRFNSLGDTLDDLFRGFLVRPLSVDGDRDAMPFRVEITEKDNAYVLRGDLPGVKKEDINVSVEDDTVAITAEARTEKAVKDGERVLRSERYYGKLYRAFTLGQAVEEDGVQAKFADGVLELTLPKKAVAQAKRITIQ